MVTEFLTNMLVDQLVFAVVSLAIAGASSTVSQTPQQAPTDEEAVVLQQCLTVPSFKQQNLQLCRAVLILNDVEDSE